MAARFNSRPSPQTVTGSNVELSTAILHARGGAPNVPSLTTHSAKIRRPFAFSRGACSWLCIVYMLTSLGYRAAGYLRLSGFSGVLASTRETHGGAAGSCEHMYVLRPWFLLHRVGGVMLVVAWSWLHG